MVKVYFYNFCIENTSKWSKSEDIWPNDLFLPNEFEMNQSSYENTSLMKILRIIFRYEYNHESGCELNDHFDYGGTGDF